MQEIGQRVAGLRAVHGDSLRDAWGKTGVSHTTIARIEQGLVAGSSHRTVKRIADGYNVPVAYLLTGDPDLLPDPVRLVVTARASAPLPDLKAAVFLQYAAILVRAAQGGLRPEMLDKAVDILLMQHHDVAAGKREGAVNGGAV